MGGMPSGSSVPSAFPSSEPRTRLIRTRAAAAPMLLGANVSIAGGVEMAPPRAKALGCDVMQIFSKNQRQWKSSPLKRESIDGYKKGVEAASLGPTLVHCSYLLNCASPDEAAWTKSWQ